jgi:hypothetical protein
MNKFTRKDFLEALFHEYFRKREGFVLVKTFRNNDRKTSTRYFPNVEILAKEQYTPDQNVFFGVCPHENMKPDKAFIQYLVALWAGLDISPEGYSGKQVYFFGQAQAAKAVRSFPLPPSIIVESGAGLHLYWLLKRITPIEDVEALEELLGRINQYFQCGTPSGIDSLMRLPGTANCKVPSSDVTCRVKYVNTDFRYDLEEFEKLNLGPVESPATGGSFLDSVPESPLDLSVSGQGRVPAGPVDSVPVKREIPREPEDFEPDEDESEYEDAGSLMESGEIHSLTVGSPADESQTVVVLAEESTDLIADEIVDKVVERLTDKLMEQLVDQIVEKLAERLMTSK